MTSVARQASIRFTVAGFREFLDTRPSEERWELIDGVPVMAAAPRVAHQRIASNLEFHLRLALARGKPEWSAEREIGIEVSDESPCRPEPEVAVVDRRHRPGPEFPRSFLSCRRGRLGERQGLGDRREGELLQTAPSRALDRRHSAGSDGGRTPRAHTVGGLDATRLYGSGRKARIRGDRARVLRWRSLPDTKLDPARWPTN